MDKEKAKQQCQECKDNWATEESCANCPVKEECNNIFKE